MSSRGEDEPRLGEGEDGSGGAYKVLRKILAVPSESMQARASCSSERKPDERPPSEAKEVRT